jgi:hypothetical protein
MTNQVKLHEIEQPKIMVILMIKNEEKIIKRCIEKILTISDAISIADTGSTDNTLEILKEYLPTLKIPTIVLNHVWKNFGHNRTLSFIGAKEYCKSLNWNPESCYGLLLDADMNLVVTDDFKKEDLTHTGYSIIQKDNNIEYYNTRFLKLSYEWKCIGVTHEYWNGNCEQLKTIYIDDIGDGGCKDDKFVRDEILLKQGLVEEPKNERYMFYLAQTLQNLKKISEAIDMYKQRIAAGGWYEEVWYSMYMLSKLYYEQKDMVEMEYWGLKAFAYNQNRAENIYFLTYAFRVESQHFKAWHYMKLGKTIKQPDDLLFIEYNVYSHLFDYEKTILSYYVEPFNKTNTLHEIIEYYNKWDNWNCYSNMQYYITRIKHKAIKNMNFENLGDYVASSTSLIRYSDDKYLINIRYVNYRIQRDGSYLIMENGVMHHDKCVCTRNFMALLDSNFNMCEPMKEMHISFPPNHNTQCKGVEDLRLYGENDIIGWIGCSSEYSHDGNIRQIIGIYDVENNQLIDNLSLHPPNPTDCEKNWIPYKALNSKKNSQYDFIYTWHPFSIGKIQDNKLVIIQRQETPNFFKHMRGSTNMVEYKEMLYCIAHIVLYGTPRKYYHLVIRINQANKIEAYTDPFYFLDNGIEYTLGLEIKDGIMYVIASRNDMNPVLISVDFETLHFNDLLI